MEPSPHPSSSSEGSAGVVCVAATAAVGELVVVPVAHSAATSIPAKLIDLLLFDHDVCLRMDTRNMTTMVFAINPSLAHSHTRDGHGCASAVLP